MAQVVLLDRWPFGADVQFPRNVPVTCPRPCPLGKHPTSAMPARRPARARWDLLCDGRMMVFTNRRKARRGSPQLVKCHQNRNLVATSARSITGALLIFTGSRPAYSGWRWRAVGLSHQHRRAEKPLTRRRAGQVTDNPVFQELGVSAERPPVRIADYGDLPSDHLSISELAICHQLAAQCPSNRWQGQVVCSKSLTVLTRDLDLSRICLDLMETKHHDVPLDVALRPLHFERVDLLGADIARDHGGVVGSKSDPATAFGWAS
jgi:hypothetical protein